MMILNFSQSRKDAEIETLRLRSLRDIIMRFVVLLDSMLILL